MNEKIPFNDINPEADTENNDPRALLTLHRVWREIFDKKSETDISEDSGKGRE